MLFFLHFRYFYPYFHTSAARGAHKRAKKWEKGCNNTLKFVILY